jgi:hypothetical protein
MLIVKSLQMLRGRVSPRRRRITSVSLVILVIGIGVYRSPSTRALVLVSEETRRVGGEPLLATPETNRRQTADCIGGLGGPRTHISKDCRHYISEPITDRY